MLVLILPTLACFGPLLPGAGPMYAFRIVAVLVILVNSGRLTRLPVTDGSRLFFILGLVWIIAGCIGLVWVQDFKSGYTELLSVAIGFVLSATLLGLHAVRSILRVLMLGWTLALMVCALVALVEIAISSHLPNYLPGRDELTVSEISAPASVFGNPNAFGLFLVCSLPVAIWGFISARGMLERAAFGALIPMIFLLCAYTGSRLSLAALALQLLVGILVINRRFRALVVLAFAGSAVGYLFWASLFPVGGNSNLPMKVFSLFDVGSLVAEASSSSASGGVRLNLFRDGLWMVWNSGGLGYGPGTFQSVMARGGPPYPTSGVLDPHNGLIQIAAQYGLLVFALFIIWFAHCFIRSMRWSRRVDLHSNGAQAAAAFCATSLVGLPLAALANSTYLTLSFVWVLVAMIMVAYTSASSLDVNTGALNRAGFYGDSGYWVSTSAAAVRFGAHNASSKPVKFGDRRNTEVARA